MHGVGRDTAMSFEPTARSAALSGFAVGVMLVSIERSAFYAAVGALTLVAAFLISLLVFAVGLANVHVRVVWSWNDLSEGEKEALARRVPLWFAGTCLGAFTAHWLAGFL